MKSFADVLHTMCCKSLIMILVRQISGRVLYHVLSIGNAIPGSTDFWYMASDGLEVICSIDGLVSWECSYHLLWMFSAIHSW